jgi:SnoaL-like domain
MGVSVEDRLHIAETMAGFAAGIDTRDWALLRSVFTDQIDVDYRSWRIDSYGPTSADAWVARATRLFPGFDGTQHALSNLRFEVDGDSATCHAYVRADHYLVNKFGDSMFTIGGMYSDRMVRNGDGWLITGKKLQVMWSQGNKHIMTLAAERAAEISTT